MYIAKNNFALSQITVSDANGKVIEKINTADQTKQINTSPYAKGIYFIKIITGDNVNTQKIIIQ